MLLRRVGAGPLVAGLLLGLVGAGSPTSAFHDVAKARLATDLEAEVLGASTYCWPAHTDDEPAECADSFIMIPPSYLPATEGAQLHFSIQDYEPVPEVLLVNVFEPVPDDFDPNEQVSGDKVLSERFGARSSVTWRPRLSPGKYVLAFSAGWEGRDARWVFGIEVLPKDADEEPPVLAKTGVSMQPGLPLLLLALAVLSVLIASRAWPPGPRGHEPLRASSSSGSERDRRLSVRTEPQGPA